MPTIHSVLLAITIVLYLLGRLCDDLAWYTWDGLSSSGFQGIALGTLAVSAIITITRRSYEENGIKTLFVESQMRFIIPWSLVILIIILLFNIFGCHSSLSEDEGSSISFEMDYTGCCLYTVVILLTNLNYSVLCNPKGDLPLLIFYEIVLFAEIVYNGSLLLRFVDQLKEKPKDYSILFVSIFIAWQVLVMDLLFRGVYEEREKELKHKELQKMVVEHKDACDVIKKNDGLGSERKLRLDSLNSDAHPPHDAINASLPPTHNHQGKK